MPYGREAGHYRDITALVHTNHPSRIPLAYKYREGDYSTRVKVIILRSRQWAPGHFPPPEDQPNQQHDRDRGLRPTNNPTIPSRELESSASSSADPIEPTIDLSCWSPRSRCPQSCSLQKWRPKTIRTQEKTNFKGKISTASPDGSPLLPLFTASSDGGPFVLMLLRGRNLDLVAADPTYFKDPPGTHPLIRISFSVPTLCHIAEHHLCVFKTLISDKKISGGSIESSAALPLASYCTLATAHKKDVTTLPLELTLLEETMHPPCPPPSFMRATNPIRSPKKPNTTFCSVNPHPSSPHRISLTGHLEYPMNIIPISFPPFSSPPLPAQITRPLLQLCLTTHATNPQHCSPHDLNFLSHNMHETALQCPHSPNEFPPSGPPKLHPQIEGSVPNPTDQVHYFAPLSDTVPSDKTKKKKSNKMATRRSPRLQAKQRPPCSVPKRSDRAKSLTNKLLFDLDRSTNAIDATVTLSILHASGLQINKQVEDMIGKAVLQDTCNGVQEESTPTPPLHDNIPPFAVPGDDLLL